MLFRSGAAPESGSSFFGLLEDLATQPLLLLEDPSGATMAEKLRGGRLGTDYLQQVGSQDPRLDVVKSGLIRGPDAEILVDLCVRSSLFVYKLMLMLNWRLSFHAHIAQHLFGFPLQLRQWPYLPSGKPGAFHRPAPCTAADTSSSLAITPLILGSICMISADRIPRYHEIAERLASSDLRDSVLNATPGQSFAQGSDPIVLNGAEPDLDLELGIGPEEVRFNGLPPLMCGP